MIVLTKSKTQVRQENDQFFEARRAMAYTDTDILPLSERVERIQYYADKPLEWMATYIPDDFSSSFASYHPEIIQYLDIRGRLVLLVVFRNSGKGTLLKGYTCHAACYGREPYITRMEHDKDTATNELLDLVREFQTNPRIISDYGMLCGDMYGMPFRPAKGEVFLRTPVLPGIPHTQEFTYMRYVGLDSIIRGTVTLNRKRIGRLIVNDPVKGYVEAHSPSHTVKVVSMIKSDAGFAGGAYTESETPISITVVGTCQARGDVIDQLRKEPMSKVLALPAIEGDPTLVEELMQVISDDILNLRDYVDKIEEEEGRNDTPEDHDTYIREHYDKYGKFVEQIQPAWEARFTIADYVFVAANWGTDVFMQEEQHETLDLATQRFHDSWFQEYSLIPHEYPPQILMVMPGHPLIYLMTIDVAGEPKEGSDPFAVYAGAYHKKLKNLYTKHYWCDQATPKELAIKVYEVFWACFPWYEGKGVVVYLEDTVGYSGIGKVYLNTVRKEMIREVEQHWQQILNDAIKEDASKQELHQIRQDAEKEISEARRYWRRLPIKMLKPVSMGNKLAGISKLRTNAQQRQIRVQRRHSQQQLLVTQFTNHTGKPTHEKLPVEYKNEGPDCVRMAFYALKRLHGIKPVFAYGDEPQTAATEDDENTML